MIRLASFSSVRALRRPPSERCCHLNTNVRWRSSKTGGSKPPPASKTATTTTQPPLEKNVLQEKAERATQLHAELEQVLHQHAKRRAKEQRAGFGSGFVKFWNLNKSEIINISAAFVCVLLAYQIANLRKAGRRLEAEVKERDAKVAEQQRLLTSLISPDFVKGIAEKASEVLDETNINRRKSWGRQSPASNAKEQSTTLAQVLQEQLEKRIGDAGMTDEEKRDKIVEKLQKAQEEILLESLLQQATASTPNVAQEPESIEVTQQEEGRKVIKKRVFSI